MVLSGEPFSGFGFLRSVSPGAASRRGDNRIAVDPAGLCRITPPGAAPGRRNGGFSRSLLYRVNQSATILSSARPFIRPAFRQIGDPLRAVDRAHRVETRSLKHAWNGIANSAYEGPAARGHGSTVV